MNILIAEDEENIAYLYRASLESRGHKVAIAMDGRECLEKFAQAMKSMSSSLSAPFDVIILDYRMPVMDGMEAAVEILRLVPEQRVIFASAYVKETLQESIKVLNAVVELLQKPFELDVLVEAVEDTKLFEELAKLNVDIRRVKEWKPTHSQVKDLLDGLLKLRKLPKNLAV
ncbi:MAG: response regulator [Nitrososphaera sp.]|nr:response regulator [Nitrososphaera sp.]